MKIKIIFSLLIGLQVLLHGQQSPSNLLQEILLKSDVPVVQQVLKSPDTFHCQIIYEEIRRDKKGKPHFKKHELNVDPKLYFYPASTIKMANAVVALEKLNDLGLSPCLTFHTDSARYPQEKITIDTTARDHIPTIAQYIKMVFVISDNAANNRLYEFIGQEELHKRLQRRGYKKTRIVHRLGDGRFKTDDNRYTNPVYLIDGMDTVYAQPERLAKPLPPLELKLSKRGKGYIDGRDSLVYESFDFSQKNYFPLREQMDMVKAILFPYYIPKKKRFNLHNDDYELLRRSMSILPRETQYPIFDTTHYHDSYVKFFMFGDSHQPIPDHIRIYNKVGWAYGFMTETAYIVDTKNNIEFLLAATIEVNRDEIFNDNLYDFDTIGLPFLAEVGRMVYRYEMKKQRK